MRSTVLTLILLLFSSFCLAQEASEVVIDQKTKEICNRIILNIYKDLIAIKDKHAELEQFDENVLYENELGIYAIVYELRKSDRQVRRHPFEFGITIVDMDDTMFEDKGRYSFNLGFPLLNLKFAGYQRRTTKYRINIMDYVNKHGDLLAAYQQDYMPLQLSLRTTKDTYYIYEPVRFEVMLTNLSNRHMKVKSINDQTMFCLFNERHWGTDQTSAASDVEEVVLKSGKSMSTEFVGEEFGKPKEISIFCSYNMSIQGVKPSGTLKVKVVDDRLEKKKLKRIEKK